MAVIVVMVFFSLALVIAGLIFFFSRLRDGDFDHGERLSLLPLADDDGSTVGPKPVAPSNGDDKLGRLGSNDTDEMGAPPTAQAPDPAPDPAPRGTTPAPAGRTSQGGRCPPWTPRTRR